MPHSLNEFFEYLIYSVQSHELYAIIIPILQKRRKQSERFTEKISSYSAKNPDLFDVIGNFLCLTITLVHALHIWDGHPQSIPKLHNVLPLTLPVPE